MLLPHTYPAPLSNKLSSETGSFPCLCYPHRTPQLKVLSPCIPSHLAPPLLSHPAALLWVLSTWLPVSAPPTCLDECFFNSFIVGIPWTLILWQFWLFIVFQLVVIFHLIVQGSEGFLPMPPFYPELAGVNHNFFLFFCFLKLLFP